MAATWEMDEEGRLVPVFSAQPAAPAGAGGSFLSGLQSLIGGAPARGPTPVGGAATPPPRSAVLPAGATPEQIKMWEGYGTVKSVLDQNKAELQRLLQERAAYQRQAMQYRAQGLQPPPFGNNERISYLQQAIADVDLKRAAQYDERRRALALRQKQDDAALAAYGVRGQQPQQSQTIAPRTTERPEASVPGVSFMDDPVFGPSLTGAMGQQGLSAPEPPSYAPPGVPPQQSQGAAPLTPEERRFLEAVRAGGGNVQEALQKVYQQRINDQMEAKKQAFEMKKLEANKSKSQTVFAKEMEKNAVKLWNDVTSTPERVATTTANLNEFEQVLKQVEGLTGPLANEAMELNKWAGVIPGLRNLSGYLTGIDSNKKLSAMQVLQSIQTKLATDMIALTKGAVSDREMQMFADSVPGITRTPEANARMIAIARRQVQFAMERAGLIQKFEKRNAAGELIGFDQAGFRRAERRLYESKYKRQQVEDIRLLRSGATRTADKPQTTGTPQADAAAQAARERAMNAKPGEVVETPKGPMVKGPDGRFRKATEAEVLRSKPLVRPDSFLGRVFGSPNPPGSLQGER